MYYIITELSLNELKNINIPTDKYGNLLLEEFYNSDKGKEFLNYDPLIISEFNKNDIFSLVADIEFLSLVCNHPMHVYIINNTWACKNMTLSFVRHFNATKVTELQKMSEQEIQKTNILIPTKQAYFFRDEDEITKVVRQTLKEFSRKNPVVSFELIKPE